MLNKNNLRELAYVAEVKAIDPIVGSDNCESATIDGWHVMVRKNEFHVGDKCVYFEIDSRLNTDVEAFAFLSRCNGKIKTQKYTFGGKGLFFSQGLIMTLEQCGLNPHDYKVGDFLTEKLGVTYADDADNKRKANDKPQYSATFKKIKKWKAVRFIMRYAFGRKLILALFGVKKKKKTSYPWFVVKSDEERCLSSRAMIMTEQGEKIISDIVNQRLPVQVLSQSPTGKFEYKPIVSYQKIERNPKTDEMYEFTFKRINEQQSRKAHLTCTGDHKLLTQRGYVLASQITTDDFLVQPTKGCNEDCIAALYGLLLGDGGLDSDKRCDSLPRVSWTQGEAHRPYAEYIKQLFINQTTEYIVRSGYSDNKIIRLSFARNPALYSALVLDNAYPNRKKYITPAYCERLSPLGLALWYMDDGTCKMFTNKHVPDRCVMEIATNAYSEAENKLLVDMLRNRFGVECKYYLTNKGYYQIYIYPEGTKQLTKIIGQYVLPEMRYKLNPTVETLYPFVQPKPFDFNEMRTISIPIQDIKIRHHIPRYAGCNKYVYDITVADNHNFVANGIVSHNCQNEPDSLFADKHTTYEITEKVDGSSTTVAIERLRKDKYKLYICSRNVVVWDSITNKIKAGGYYANLEKNPFIASAEQYQLCEFLTSYMNYRPDVQWTYLQGETYGAGIQKRTYHLNATDFRAFTLVDSQRGRYTYSDMATLLNEYDIPSVPILQTGFVLPDTCDEVVAMASGDSKIDGEMREGIVLRSEQDTSFSFKAVDPNFLVKYHG